MSRGRDKQFSHSSGDGLEDWTEITIIPSSNWRPDRNNTQQGHIFSACLVSDIEAVMPREDDLYFVDENSERCNSKLCVAK